MKRRQLVDAEFVRGVEWTPELLMRELGGTQVHEGILHEVVDVSRLSAISESMAERLLAFWHEAPPTRELFELTLKCGVRLTVWPSRPWSCMDVRARCSRRCQVVLPKSRSSDPGWWDGEAREV